jgi:predicted nucleotidyltransferase
LHGSFTEGLPYRDIDLAVYLEERFAGDPYGVLDRIHRRWPFPAEELDVRVLNEAPVSFRYHALKGRLVGLHNEELYGAVFENTVRTYLDEAPLRHRAIREAFA